MFIRNDKNLSFVRVLHASPDAPPVDIYVDGKLIFKDLAFKNFTEYVPLAKGTYKFDVYPVGKTEKPVLSQSIDIPENEVITVAAAGDLIDLQLVAYFELNPKDIMEGKTRVRFIHLSPDAPAVEILLDNRTAFNDVGFLDATDYLDIPAGTYTIEIDISDTKDRLIEMESEFKSQKVYTIYILGNLTDLTTIQSVDGSTYMRY